MAKINAVDCYLEEVRQEGNGRSILSRRAAVLLGSDTPRLKILDPPSEYMIKFGIVSRPSDKLFLGVFMADELSHFDHGEVKITENISNENLQKLVSAGILSIDDRTKSIIRESV